MGKRTVEHVNLTPLYMHFFLDSFVQWYNIANQGSADILKPLKYSRTSVAKKKALGPFGHWDPLGIGLFGHWDNQIVWEKIF